MRVFAQRLACATLVAIGLQAAASGASPPPGPPLPPPRPADIDVPLPPRRPPDLVVAPALVAAPPEPAAAPPSGPPQAGISAEPAPTPATPESADETLACARLLASGKVQARALAPIEGGGGCGIAAPIALSAVVLSAKRLIGFDPPVTINCALGDALADWLRDDLAPAFDREPSPLAALEGTAGYECRGRNRIAGAKLSEHARGNAVDIAAMKTADGILIRVDQTGAPMLATVRTTACARFATVLGPGSDAFHASHLHVDLEPRRHGTRICQWTLP